MTIQQIYDLAIEMGIKADPRGEPKVKKYLEGVKKAYEEMPEKKKRYFDPESLENPYSDTRILVGEPSLEVKKVMAGIDSDGGEVLLVDRLNYPSTDSTGSSALSSLPKGSLQAGSGLGINLLISHHPGGHALAALHEVMELQVDMFAKAGVPENVAHSLFEQRMQHVHRRFSPLNHGQAVDAAKLLNIPLMAIHTVWDNLGHDFVEKYLQGKEFETAGDVLDVINEIPEFVEAIKGKNGPFLAAGSEKNRAGKIVVGFTGGTSPSKELYMELAKAGVGTIVEMHVPEEALDELKKLHVNVIDCGHMAADSVGANIFLDELEKKGVEVVPCSGLVRVKRGAKK